MYTELLGNVYTILLFKGVVDTIADLPETAKPGDTWLVKTTDSTYVYSGTDWVCASTGDTQSSKDSDSTVQIHTSQPNPVAQICTQCHGTLELDKFGRLHCPYCGTLYK